MSDFNHIVELIQKKAVLDNVVQHLKQFTPTDVQPTKDRVITASYGDVTVRVNAKVIEEVLGELQTQLDEVVATLEENTNV